MSLATQSRQPDCATALSRWAGCRRGATSIEYAVIIGIVFMAIVIGIRSFAAESGEMYNEISSAVQKR